MRDSSDRRPITPTANTSYSKKRLGGYLVEAGLLTPAQIDVALNDQKLTGMRFGEILAARGWVKQQTIEYLMHKVVLPEQQDVKQPQNRMVAATQPGNAGASASLAVAPHTPDTSKQATRRDAPIAKPLSSSGKSDGDVSWVG